jgi:hypothetical protein
MPYLVDQPPLRSIAGRWLRDSLQARGTGATLKYLATQSWEVLKDSMPERRRSRFGDIDYDCDYGVDTTWARLPWRVRLREIFAERLYQPTAPDEFDTIMQHLATVDFSEFTFIDMGSGKGRVLLMAAMYPFDSIIGVEVQPDLHAIAEQNIAMFDVPGRQCEMIESVCMDAREYLFPQTPLLVYLFNPFPDYVLRSVLDNLGRSLAKHPRTAFVAYNAPFEQHAFQGLEWLQKIVQDDRYQIYRACL